MEFIKKYNLEGIRLYSEDVNQTLLKAQIVLQYFRQVHQEKGVDIVSIRIKAREILDSAGEEMSQRTFMAGSFDDPEFVDAFWGNEKILKTINNYIIDKALNPCGANMSRKLREILSEEWTNSYVSLIIDKLINGMAEYL